MSCNNNYICYGLRGPTGIQGPPGSAGTIEVGTVTVGAPGTLPLITNVGTDTAAILNFVIPTGPQGIQGPIGPIGPQGIQGDIGAVGPTGPSGAPGADGIAATIEIGTVTTGDTASVTNVGTNTAAVLDFVLPLPTETTPAYIDLQNTTASAIAAPGNIPLTSLRNNEITPLTGGGAIVADGLYEIEYMVKATSPVTATVGLVINGTNDTTTNIALSDTLPTAIYKTIIPLTAGNTVELNVVTVTDSLTLADGGVNAYLLIKEV